MMYHHQNSRRATMNNSNEGSRRNTFVEQRQDQSSNQAGTNPDSEKEEQQNKQPEHSHSYRVLAPNDKKRRELIQQRERNMQYYEEVKASNRMKYDSEGPKKIELLRKSNGCKIHIKNLQKLMLQVYKCINKESPPFMWNIFHEKSSGSKVSQDDVLEKRIKDQKRAEALEKRKSYEQKKKREKWAAEKKSVEEKEIMERKLRARAQTERNEEKRRQEEIAKKKRYDAEMRRRWQDVGDDDMGRKAGVESNPSTDELREVYARRYGSSQIEEPSSDRIQVRNCVHQALQRRTTDNLQASPYEECLDRFSNLNTEEDTSLSESEQDEDIRKLCQMFPCVERELIEDIYAQTNNSLANSRAILSTS